MADNDVRLNNLRCEYHVNPLGIDVRKPRLSWEMESNRRGQRQTAYQVLVAASQEKLKEDQGDLWDSGKVNGDQSIHIEYAGQKLRSRMRCYWKVRVWDKGGEVSAWSEPAFWSMGLLEQSDWQAQWITCPADKLMKIPEPQGQYSISPIPYLRKSFSTKGKCVRATAFVTGVGLYRLSINGRRVGSDVLAPEWTVYAKRIQYRTFDVTELINAGENAIGAIIGSGWYGDHPMFAMPPLLERVFKARPGFVLRLEIEGPDGKTQSIVTDESWKVSTEGPIRISSIYQGETYDARLELTDWNTRAYDDSHWEPAVTADFAGANLVWQRDPPIRITEEISPVGMTEPKPGVYVFDMGQNMVGWCRLQVRGDRGSEVVLRHAEFVTDDGNIYTANLSDALQTDRFILSGSGPETFEPHFTYHGFRYVEVTGLQNRPKPRDLTGCVFHNDAPMAGTFQCSNMLVNKLMSNILWSLRGNLMGTPTDCPQRNERAGWMGDMQSFSQTAVFNMDMAAFFNKWVIDIRDSQGAEGIFSEISPNQKPASHEGSGGPGWSDAGIIIPWRVYQNYCDKRMLEEHYDSAKRWIDWIHSQNQNLIWENRRGGDWGDWLNGDTLTVNGWPQTGGQVPKEIFATAYFAHSTETVSKMAKVLGREDDAMRYARLFEGIKDKFCQTFVRANGQIKGDTQAGYALALQFNLLPTPLRSQAVQHMLAGLERYNGHLSTGIHSTHPLMLQLTRSGHHDKACRLINLRSIPSWGYTIDMEATTIWERWDGRIKGRGNTSEGQFEVGDPIPGMNSFNHYVLGSVGEWIWRNLVGINPDESRPGYKHFDIRPCPGPGFTWVKGSYKSIHGPIGCDWRKDGDRFILHVSVPANTSATIYIPTENPDGIQEGNVPAQNSPEVIYQGQEKNRAVFKVGSGTYRLVSSLQ